MKNYHKSQQGLGSSAIVCFKKTVRDFAKITLFSKSVSFSAKIGDVDFILFF